MDWQEDEHRPTEAAADPVRPLARVSAATAWRAWAAGLVVFAALNRLVDATVLPAHLSLWRILVLSAVCLAAAGYFWLVVPAAARPSRLLVWFTAAGYCGLFAILELALREIGEVARAAAETLAWWRLTLVGATAAATTVLFNRITARMLAETAAERAALERAHADALRLEGVLLAARTTQHRINNSLAVVTAYAERLANDPALSTSVRGRALVVLDAAETASRYLADLGRVTRLERDQTLGFPMIDVERSIEAREPAEPVSSAGEPTHEGSGR